MLHERGLAYQAESLVNYDPVDRTVLANEQVDANGCSWRSGAKVEKKMLKQWFLKIKEFQEPLLKDLDLLTKDGNWPERVVAMQKNWIGRSQGTKLSFDIQTQDKEEHFDPVEVFTTRADTLCGVQYLALSLTHPIVKKLAETDDRLRSFINQAEQLPPESKAGYLLHSIFALHPLRKALGSSASFCTDKIPVYVAPYVLDDYGSGAVMGVPGHDSRDHAFWRTNAGNSDIRTVICSKSGAPSSILEAGTDSDKPLLEKGFLASDIPIFGGLSSEDAVPMIVKQLEQTGQLVQKTENWRLRDWLVSRQRYWGAPIPIVHCDSCGPVPVPVADLPVRLPQLPDEYFKGKTGNPLAEHPTWKKTTCPSCGSPAERETDTMDTFMDSSWYFFRFLSPNLETAPVSSEKANSDMPVDLYIGGVEHAILHLLYARFISKFLATTPLWPEGNQHNGEPFKKLVTQGMVHGKTYSDPHTGRFLKPEEVDHSNESAPVIIATGETPKVSFEKMSKSKYNGVDPGDTIAKHGADVTRAHMLFQAPVGDVLEWDGNKITGVERWLHRVLRLSRAAMFIPPPELADFHSPRDLDERLGDILRGLQLRKGDLNKKLLKEFAAATPEELLAALKPEEALLWTKLQQTIASVTTAYGETISLNTVVSDLMTLTNAIWDTPHTSSTVSYLKFYAVGNLLRMLAPIAPGTAEEGWEALHSSTNERIQHISDHPFRNIGKPNAGPADSVFAFGFPKADLDVLPMLNVTQTCVFMVAGKKKFDVQVRKVPGDIRALGKEKIKRFVLEQVLQTEQGKEWLGKGTGKVWQIAGTEEVSEEGFVPKGWRVVVPLHGGLVNIAPPKKGEKGGSDDLA
jgi:leucyl-tRNA synthetase